MKMKHTSKPWIKRGHQILGRNETEAVATVYGFNTEEKNANAKLIAAAPELLEALIKMYLAEYSPQNEPLEKVMLVGEVTGDEFERSIIEVIKNAIV